MYFDLNSIDSRLEINNNERKQIILTILDEFVGFCDSHNLKYSLGYGTLLGAIRHKGFIPWDDDLDIIMPRKDYEYFLSNYKNNRFKVISPYNSKLYYLHFAKFYDVSTVKITNLNIKKHNSLFGLEIDIFPFDFIDDKNKNNNIIKKQIRYINRWKKTLLHFSISFFKHPKKLFEYLLYGGRSNYYSKKFDKASITKTLKHSFTIKYDFFFARALCFSGDLFDDLICLDFEGKKYKAISRYDEFLKANYGEYMKLPPEEKRISHHDDHAFYARDV